MEMVWPASELLAVLLMAMNNSITVSESMALSIIRVMAMMLIIACHVCQCYGYKMAFVFNVGVQLFFVISGFLYGKLELPQSPFEFYKKRLVKVYLPYILWVLLIVVVYSVFGLYRVTVKQIVFYVFNLQGFATPIEGLNHLWFLTVLMFCYLTTPWVKKIMLKHESWFVVLFVVCCIVEFLLLKKLYSLIAWIALYYVGLVFGFHYSKRLSNIILVACSVALIILGMKFNIDMLTSEESTEYSIWLHWIMGLFLFSAIYRCLSSVSISNHKIGVVSHFDKLSYDVYLIHHPLIMGPLSLMFITKYCCLNVIIMLVSVYLLALVFHLIHTKIVL